MERTPSVTLTRASSLWEGAFGMTVKFPVKVQSLPYRKAPLPPPPGRGMSFLKGRGLCKEMKLAFTTPPVKSGYRNARRCFGILN